MIKELMKCEIHNLEYEATIYPQIGIITKCPECLKEMRERKAQEQKEQEKRMLDEKKKLHFDYLVKFSNIPKRYLNSSFDFTKKAEFQEHILTDDNLIIIGDTGTGKTCYISQIIKDNIDKCGIYLNSNELAVFKNSYRIDKILDSIESKGIVAIDEIQVLLDNRDYFLIDLIIDKAYLNGARIIIAGNITKQALTIFKNAELKRSGSRLKDCEQLRILDFGLDDLRC